ncbi:N-acetylmuramate alpha-1-phosphate uridylyltransferase MurU [Niveibacterium sp. SC-1]|uniref:N-acetylmuramate alpha-1-phosphate uridylyltransferase MurU n=1 Tax=Niveibacterium sp. SC-1 TaxID=3135646 RepID=UPI00311F8FE0
MILAAGRGERMKPLTDHTPKPLLAVGGKPLIVWHIEALARAGVRELVINHAWLGDKLEAALGDGGRFGVSIAWSREGEALETAGGIATALPLLGDGPFIVLNGDVFADYPVPALLAAAQNLERGHREAHLVLVPYPQHKAGAHLGLDDQGLVRFGIEGESLTYSGLGAYHPAFFAGCRANEKRPLLPLFETGAARGVVGGETHRGAWTDVGTPERLAELDAQLSQGKLLPSEVRA